MDEVVGDGQPLRVGITAPFNDHQVSYEVFLELARRVEAAGFDSLWMADHLTGPTPMGATRWFDVVTLLANLTAHAPRLRVGTDVLVAAYRHPVLAAKMLTTLDTVSGGQLTVGVGTGYIEKEFEELQVPFHRRGRYTAECIRVWKEIWSPGPANFDGEFFQLRDTVAEPKPRQQPHPPIHIGGSAPAVLRRVVELGDGWQPISQPMDAFRTGVDRLKQLAAAAERDRPITLAYSGGFGLVAPNGSDAADRLPLVGTPDQVLHDIDDLRALGVSHVIFRPGLVNASNEEVLDQVDYIADTVLTRLARK
jgi:probable F420-dependent oxidoreductase